jgi:hypothetical protein
MSTQSQETFIQSIKEVETRLTDIGLSHLSTTKKGYATYIDFKSTDKTQVSFMFGPSDWHVEIVFTANDKKYEFKDLLQIHAVAQWTRDNKFQPKTNDMIKDEVDWLVDLLTFVVKAKLGQSR